jgi:hypothetical protein
MRMTLDLDRPDIEDIRRVLAAVGKHGDSFVILAQSDRPLAYMQTKGGPAGFLVEYRENGRQFRAEDENLPDDMTEALFLSYERNNDAWRTLVCWRDVSTEIKSPPKHDKPRRQQRHPSGLLKGLAAILVGDLFDA